MVDIMLKGISNKMIVLMEGSTGIGKSRVIATTVLRLAGKKIGIFAPTLAILYQLFEEFLHTAGKDHPRLPSTLADAILSIAQSLKIF